MTRESRKLMHGKQIETSVKESKEPNLAEIRDNVPEIRFIQGQGLYWIIKYDNKLKYLKFSDTL